MATDRTEYSAVIKGARGNYNWGVRFDISGSGYLGVTQFEGDQVKDRVLLSPSQVKEMVAFSRRKPK